MLMIELPNLEFHAAHACNLYCAQCSHYSNFHAGGIVSLDEARANFDAWKGRLAPKRIAILGGEPTLNPELISIIELARQSFPNAEGLFVTNGFFLDRHPDLPRVLIDNRFRMDVSQHGRAPEYMKRFRVVCQQSANGEPTILICKSTSANPIVAGVSSTAWWMASRCRSKAIPRAAWKICLQRTCTQLYKSCLWKCPALAYHAIMSRKLRLDQEPAWQLFRDYRGCPPTASNDEVKAFISTQEIPQCSLCPAKKIHFHHLDPTLGQ
jgi:hypothetical protein